MLLLLSTEQASTLCGLWLTLGAKGRDVWYTVPEEVCLRPRRSTLRSEDRTCSWLRAKERVSACGSFSNKNCLATKSHDAPRIERHPVITCLVLDPPAQRKSLLSVQRRRKLCIYEPKDMNSLMKSTYKSLPRWLKWRSRLYSVKSVPRPPHEMNASRYVRNQTDEWRWGQ